MAPIICGRMLKSTDVEWLLWASCSSIQSLISTCGSRSDTPRRCTARLGTRVLLAWDRVQRFSCHSLELTQNGSASEMQCAFTGRKGGWNMKLTKHLVASCPLSRDPENNVTDPASSNISFSSVLCDVICSLNSLQFTTGKPQ